MSTRNKKAIASYREAENHAVRREYGKALDDLEKALAKDKKFAEAHLLAGSVYNVLENYGRASYHYGVVTQLYPDSRQYGVAWFFLGEILFQQEKYEEAANMFEHFKGLGLGERNMKAATNKYLRDARFAADAITRPLPLQPAPLPLPINRLGLQYFPVLTVDQQELFFTGRVNHLNADEDIYRALRNEDGSWGAPVPVSEVINTNDNEGTCTISADGRMLIFTACQGRQRIGSCDLFVSYKVGDEWSEPENLGARVNSKAWDSQPTLSADGRTLYFVSNRSGGYGKRDIWMSRRRADGRWTVAKNLGDGINTPDEEVSPFIHVSGKILYFASKGRAGFGGYDIYQAESDGLGWAAPQNLGYPINNTKDQMSLFITADGQKAFYSMDLSKEGNRATRTVLMSFDMPEPFTGEVQKQLCVWRGV